MSSERDEGNECIGAKADNHYIHQRAMGLQAYGRDGERKFTCEGTAELTGQ